MNTAPRKRTWLWWSSGKDSLWTLHRLRRNLRYEVTALVTTLDPRGDRVATHGVRGALVRAQAAAAGLPLVEVPIPHPCPNERYEDAVRAVTRRATAQGVAAMAFGDLHLEDVRAYRERLFDGLGVETVFPLRGEDTAALARRMLAAGVAARVTCLDPRQLPRELAGRCYDAVFLAALPAAADPCGENGEFHTFVTAGPELAREVAVEVGATVERDGFLFTDLEATSPGSTRDERSTTA